jgi:hypothetical protein
MSRGIRLMRGIGMHLSPHPYPKKRMSESIPGSRRGRERQRTAEGPSASLEIEGHIPQRGDLSTPSAVHCAARTSPSVWARSTRTRKSSRSMASSRVATLVSGAACSSMSGTDQSPLRKAIAVTGCPSSAVGVRPAGLHAMLDMVCIRFDRWVGAGGGAGGGPFAVCAPNTLSAVDGA